MMNQLIVILITQTRERFVELFPYISFYVNTVYSVKELNSQQVTPQSTYYEHADLPTHAFHG